MRTIAIIGASGFIGTRLVEVFYLGGVARVRPIVRHFTSLARLSRFELDCRMADARDEAALTKAFEGCDAVVNAAVGDDRIIEGIIKPVWKACVAARVRRLVYLSSGSVHGQAPAQGTDEATPLSDQQWHWYNNAKVRAEWKLKRASKNEQSGIGGVAPDDCFWTSFAMGLGCSNGNCQRTRVFAGRRQGNLQHDLCRQSDSRHSTGDRETERRWKNIFSRRRRDRCVAGFLRADLPTPQGGRARVCSSAGDHGDP